MRNGGEEYKSLAWSIQFIYVLQDKIDVSSAVTNYDYFRADPTMMKKLCKTTVLFGILMGIMLGLSLKCIHMVSKLTANETIRSRESREKSRMLGRSSRLSDRQINEPPKATPSWNSEAIPVEQQNDKIEDAASNSESTQAHERSYPVLSSNSEVATEEKERQQNQMVGNAQMGRESVLEDGQASPQSLSSRSTIATNKSVSIFLIRAIGNPLPPRHDPQQAITNLRFTLQYEPGLALDKHWLLNRLVNQTLENELIKILEEYKQPYTVLKFDMERYVEVPYQFGYYQPLPDYIHSPKYVWQTANKNETPDIQVEEAIMADKNLYVTNQNTARNAMIQIGLNATNKNYHWILPWDGNCFLTSTGFEQLYQALQSTPSKYAITPMARAITSNKEVLEPNYNPTTTEEPQIAFHRDAQARFHPKLRYGRRNKVELLMRLGVPGPWDKWSPYLEWEKRKLGPFFQPVRDKPASTGIPSAGFVTRLTSGVQHLETQGMIHNRGVSRTESVKRILTELDVRSLTELFNLTSETLLFYDEYYLSRDRRLMKTNNSSPVFQSLMDLANAALNHGPWSVTDKPRDSLAPSNDAHDYFHPAPYFWPAKDSEGNIDPNAPYVQRDGIRVPGTMLYEDGSENFDRTRLTAMQYNTTVLALAYYFTSNPDFAKTAARNVRAWFLHPKTRMNPTLRFAQVRRNHAGNNEGYASGVIEMKDLYFFLDAVRILSHGDDAFLQPNEQSKLREWFRKYLEWLESSAMGTLEFSRGNNHGLYYDIQVISIAAYIGDYAKMLWYTNRAVSRLRAHVDRTGAMPRELNRPICEHYQMFTLQGWSTLARIAKKMGRMFWEVDLRGTRGAKLPSLCKAAEYAIPFFRQREVCTGNQGAADQRRWWPLLQDARTFCDHYLFGKDRYWNDWMDTSIGLPPQSAYHMPSLFHPHDGIAPFWNLGSSYAPHSWPNQRTTVLAYNEASKKRRE